MMASILTTGAKPVWSVTPTAQSVQMGPSIIEHLAMPIRILMEQHAIHHVLLLSFQILLPTAAILVMIPAWCALQARALIDQTVYHMQKFRAINPANEQRRCTLLTLHLPATHVMMFAWNVQEARRIHVHPVRLTLHLSWAVAREIRDFTLVIFPLHVMPVMMNERRVVLDCLLIA